MAIKQTAAQRNASDAQRWLGHNIMRGYDPTLPRLMAINGLLLLVLILSM